MKYSFANIEAMNRRIKTMLKSDYHMHPLNHRYRGIAPAALQGIELTEKDRADIRAVVDWCAEERRLASIALTDHDMVQPGLYAQEYARINGLAIAVIPGAECEVTAPGYPPGKGRVHVLCYGVTQLPAYTHDPPCRSLPARHVRGVPALFWRIR